MQPNPDIGEPSKYQNLGSLYPLQKYNSNLQRISCKLDSRWLWVNLF